MFGKHLRKSVATAAAVGAVLAVAATSTSGVVTTSPAIKNVACQDNYPNPAASNTNLTLTRSIAQYGQRNRANVSVTSNSQDATGSVRISVGGKSWTVPLSSGEASHAIPRTLLDAGDTYTVRARYIPDCANGQVAGSSDTEPLTVVRAETNITTKSARNIERGERPLVRAIVTSTISPGGNARVTITNGDAEKSMVVGVEKLAGDDSLIRALFSRTYKLGSWDVKIKYLGNGNFEPARSFADFNVSR